MIQSFLHIIIATTLLLSTSGVTVTAYFCGDHLSGLSILPPSECESATKACCIKAEGKKKCCTSDSEFVQIDIDQLSYPIADFADIDVENITLTAITHTEQAPINILVNTALYYRPPPLLINHIIAFQNFRC